MKCKKIVLEIVLYDYDENDQQIPMNDEQAKEALEEISYSDNVQGYFFTDIRLEECEV